jgi:hypothetical protein
MTREPFIAHSELTNEIYIVVGKEKYRVTEQAIKAVMAIKALEQEPILDKIRAEVVEYGSIWVEYKITGKRDKDIEQLVSDVLKQAKEQVLKIIDKYKAESEDKE